MTQKALSKRLKLILLGIGICGIAFYCLILPFMCKTMFDGVSRMTTLIFLWITAIPCYIALILAEKIANNIGNDRSFTTENAKLLKHISNLAIIIAAYMFIGTVLLTLSGIMELLSVIIFFILAFASIAVSITAAALSHLVTKAAELQLQNDLTI